MKNVFCLLTFLLFNLSTLHAQFQNIEISNSFNPNEPSIMISPIDTNIIVAGGNIFNQYYSSDGGYNWQRNTLTSSFGVWGDPTIAVDTSGIFYFLHLSNPSNGNWIDRIVVQKSMDNGQTWDDGTFVGLNGTKAQDKQWPVINPMNNHIYVTWTEFDAYGSADALDKSRILFSKSEDMGETWMTPVKINEVDGDCLDSDLTTEGAVPAIGPNGEIYVAWAGPAGLVFDKSLDDGLTWMSNDLHINDFVGGWDFEIEGLSRANGLPVTICDRSGTSTHGNIYINWADQSNGSDTDIWMVKSTDNGETWSAPLKINDDQTQKDQFFTWMTIDQSTGFLYCVFYDRRNYEDTQTDVYMAYSVDGGNSFTNVKISASPFMPTPNVFFGDYNNIAASNGCIRPIWTRLNNGDLSLQTAIIHHEDLLTKLNDIKGTKKMKVKVFPNPSQDTAYLSFKLHEESIIGVRLLDDSGKLISDIIQNEKYPFGKHIIKMAHKDLVDHKGQYILELTINGKILKSQKLIIQ